MRRSSFKIAVYIWIAIQAAGLGSAANTYYVATNGSDGAVGTSWGTALRTISNGVNKATAAGAGSLVAISNGVYYLSTQVVVSASIRVQGCTTNAADVVVNGNATTRCFDLSGSAAVANLTITNGFVLGDGGGAYVSGATLQNCLIIGNTATNHGGGVYAAHGGGLPGILVNCTVAGNLASNGNGGGVYCYNIGYLYDSLISNNQSRISHSGGVYIGGAGLIQGCQIIGNQAWSGPGGAYLGSWGIMTNCLVQNNRLNGDGAGGYNGAGIFNSAWKVLQCRIIGNNAGKYYGGGVSMWQLNGQSVENCQIVSNTALSGGGVNFGACNGMVRNCLIAGNTATDRGGGVYNQGVAGGYIGALVSCTVVDNLASNQAGGVCCNDYGSHINCVISSNRLINGATPNWINAGAQNMTYSNCLSTPLPAPGSGNIAANPQFVAPGAGTYRLRGGSQGVNSGLYQSWMTNAVDLDGYPRIRYNRVDMGCYETLYQGTVFKGR